MSVTGFVKDPIEELDYGFNLEDWLSGAETIVDVDVEADPPGLVVVDTPTISGTQILAWVTGGNIDDRVVLKFTATTNSTPRRVIRRSLTIHVEEK